MEAASMLNQAVVHKTYGKGTITRVDEKYLEVAFAEGQKVSKFAYPSCFHGFLSFEDEVLQDEAQQRVDTWMDESGTRKSEALYKKYEKTMRGIEERRAAAEEKKLKAAQRAMEHRTNYNRDRHAGAFVPNTHRKG